MTSESHRRSCALGLGLGGSLHRKPAECSSGHLSRTKINRRMEVTSIGGRLMETAEGRPRAGVGLGGRRR